MITRCSNCQTTFKALDDWLGRTAKCPKCRQSFVIEMLDVDSPHGTTLCPNCTTRLRVLVGQNGKSAKCPKCGKQFDIKIPRARQPRRNPAEGKLKIMQGYICSIVGASLALLILVDVIPGCVTWFLVTALTFGGISLITTGRKLCAPDPEAVLRNDKRPPIIYLRSFRQDGVDPIADHAMFGIPGHTDEEHLARLMNKIGPFIALGKPGDVMPDLGAFRMYVHPDEWQLRIAELLNRAQLVVFRVGVTRGLWWELARLRKTVSPTRVLLFLGVSDRERPSEDEYAEFRKHADKILGCMLPEQIGIAPFITFDSQWNACPPERHRSLLAWASHKTEHKMLAAMQPVLDKNGIDAPKLHILSTPLRIFVIFVVCIFLVPFLVVGVLRLLDGVVTFVSSLWTR